jgi:sarcosine/dimethylglycine N-methyltransferase
MRQDERAAFDEALETARRAAYEPGEFVGQESFMRASEIRELAVAAGVGPDVSVLDLCCGVAGPGRFITAELGCDYLGVDSSPSTVEIARARAAGLPCRFQVARIPPVPSGRFDVVLLLETMLAFPDKAALLTAISSVLPPGGRFACTVEEGRPLTEAERAAMPEADTVWPIPQADLLEVLARAGLRVTWITDRTAAHRETADALTAAFTAERPAIAARVGERAIDDLLDAHRLWSRWLASRRVRKLALVAQRTRPSAGEPEHDPVVERAHLD